MDERRGTFVKQAAILAAAGILSRVLGFALRIPLTNTLGDEGMGIYGDGYNVYNFFFILSSAGLPNAIAKLVSERNARERRDEAHKVFKTALICAFVLGAAGTAVLAAGAGIFAGWVNNPRAYYTLIALSPTVLVVAVMAVFRGYFQGVGSTAPTALSQLVEQLFNLIASIALMLAFMNVALPESNKFFGDKIALGAAGGQLGTFVGALAGLAFVTLLYLAVRPTVVKAVARARTRVRREKLPVSSRAQIVRALFFTAVPIIAGGAVFSFSNLIDSAMVKGRLMSAGFLENEAVALFGIYNGKYITIATLPVSITSALATAIIPSLAGNYARKERKAVKDKAFAAIKMSMLISFPAAVGLAALSDPIIRLIFPGAPEGADLLLYGSAAIVLLSLSQISTGILQGTDKIIVPVVAALLGVLVKIPLNFILCGIPEINIYGAVISTTACYLVSGGVNLYMVSKLTKSNINSGDMFVRPLLASLGMGGVAFIFYGVAHAVFPSNAIATVFAISAGIVAYAFFIIILEGVKERDLRMLPMFGGVTDRLKRRGWIS